jgi:hypothetical protein
MGTAEGPFCLFVTTASNGKNARLDAVVVLVLAACDSAEIRFADRLRMVVAGFIASTVAFFLEKVIVDSQ